MKFSLAEIAQLLGADIEGDPAAEVDQIAKIEEGTPGSICFLANPKYTPFIYETQATAVIVAHDFEATAPIQSSLLRVADPYGAFTKLLQFAQQAQASQQPDNGIEQPAFVHERAQIGKDVYIGAFCYIAKDAVIGDHVKIYPHSYIGEGATVGDNSVLYPGVTVYHGCQIGNDCILHAGVCLGSDGFGFAPQADGTFQKIPQTGGVILGDQVEIGANTTIDRATIGNTEIQLGTKLDNLVQIAHNVKIGQHTVIAAQAGIAGSTQVGKGVMIGGQAGLVGHLKIADGSKIDAQSGVNKSIKDPNLAFRGSPAQAYRQQLKSEVLFRKLSEMNERVRVLELQLKDLS